MHSNVFLIEKMLKEILCMKAILKVKSVFTEKHIYCYWNQLVSLCNFQRQNAVLLNEELYCHRDI